MNGYTLYVIHYSLLAHNGYCTNQYNTVITIVGLTSNRPVILDYRDKYSDAPKSDSHLEVGRGTVLVCGCHYNGTLHDSQPLICMNKHDEYFEGFRSPVSS